MMRRLLPIVMVWAAADAVAYACPVCFQMEDGATASGVRAAVFVLLGVTVAVLGAVAWWIKRSRLLHT